MLPGATRRDAVLLGSSRLFHDSPTATTRRHRQRKKTSVRADGSDEDARFVDAPGFLRLDDVALPSESSGKRAIELGFLEENFADVRLASVGAFFGDVRGAGGGGIFGTPTANPFAGRADPFA